MRETEPAASTAARTKPATAADRLVSGHATTISLALRSLTGTKARPDGRCRPASEAGT